MLASIIICTYNRSDLLKDSITSIQNQCFPMDQFEIVVVDNNSFDNTRQIFDQLARVSPVPIKYVFEERQGLSYARNSGIEYSVGEIVVFTDDDVIAEKTWLREMLSVFDNHDVACVGGPIRPIWPFEKPSWLNADWLIEPLSVSEFNSAKDKSYFTGHYPFGANIAFRRDSFNQFGVFSLDLGRQAGRLLSNEEIELCQRIEAAGKLIGFAPNAIIYHKIAPERLTKQWFYRRFYWQGRSDAVLDANLGRDVYGRLRQCVTSILTSYFVDGHVDFYQKCKNRMSKGYLHQRIIQADTGEKGNTYRPIRAFEKLLNTMSATSTSTHNLADEALKEKIRLLEEQVAGLQASNSWRITAPLRAIHKWIMNISK
ncbi:MAG: glycosyltransferase [Geobacteraceae bacterium]|nr:glycosyltransferase [Geobacteraceae bacterium]